ncbi:MAG: hypothetical protein KGR26_02290 [Cyanobacteria bacterium REEB65]|nr:hypothetical protein [Cyanobacteria bacterium REEB65]
MAEAQPICDRCGRPVRWAVTVGDKQFCRPRCRAEHFAARKRKAAAQNKTLACPSCNNHNPALRRRCQFCHEKILWFEESPIRATVRWIYRLWFIAIVGGAGIMAYRYRDLLPFALAFLHPQGHESAALASTGTDPLGQELDAVQPAVPGPGTWLVPQGGMPAMLFASDPTRLLTATFANGTMPDPASLARNLGAQLLGGKLKMRAVTRVSAVRVLDPGPAFSHVIVAGYGEGWAPTGQLVQQGQ